MSRVEVYLRDRYSAHASDVKMFTSSDVKNECLCSTLDITKASKTLGLTRLPPQFDKELFIRLSLQLIEPV